MNEREKFSLKERLPTMRPSELAGIVENDPDHEARSLAIHEVTRRARSEAERQTLTGVQRPI